MKINWNDIPGFKSEMTAEERLSLLESWDNPEKTISKARFDEVASQLAAANKALKSRASDDEAKENERNAVIDELKAKLDAAERRETLAGYKSEMLALGFSDSEAAATAEALADGKFTDVFSALKGRKDNMEKDIRASILQSTEKPPAGDDPEGHQKSAAENFVSQLAAESAQSDKVAQDAMNYYIGGKTE